MAITHTQTITLMEVLRNNSDDVVENINTLLFYVYENGQVAKRVILK